ncbi:MAG: GNAT family N-acetyltransferase [Thermotogota bacterium]
MMKIENNKNNLFKTYIICGKYKNSLVKTENFESIFIKNNYWPEYTFNIDSNFILEIESIKQKIKNHEISNNFLIFSDNLQTKNILDKNNYKPKDLWHIMNLEKDTVFMTTEKKDTNFKIKKLKKENLYLWNDFIGLDIDFVEFLYDNDFHFYVLMIDDLVVSTSLFNIIDNSVNIYMVGTKKEFRNKGYASTLMKNNLNGFINKGLKKFYLQSTHLGKKLYDSLGFSKVGEAWIYNIL